MRVCYYKNMKNNIKSESKAIIANDPGGECPDCKWKIRKDVHEGTECRNCGHVFSSDSGEQQRRDEKNGLYSELEDVAN